MNESMNEFAVRSHPIPSHPIPSTQNSIPSPHTPPQSSRHLHFPIRTRIHYSIHPSISRPYLPLTPPLPPPTSPPLPSLHLTSCPNHPSQPPPPHSIISPHTTLSHLTHHQHFPQPTRQSSTHHLAPLPRLDCHPNGSTHVTWADRGVRNRRRNASQPSPHALGLSQGFLVPR